MYIFVLNFAGANAHLRMMGEKMKLILLDLLFMVFLLLMMVAVSVLFIDDISALELCKRCMLELIILVDAVAIILLSVWFVVSRLWLSDVMKSEQVKEFKVKLQFGLIIAALILAVLIELPAFHVGGLFGIIGITVSSIILGLGVSLCLSMMLFDEE